MTTFSETTLPALIFSVPVGHPKGNVPALGRLTINEAQAVDQWWVTWGMETNDDYTHTDSTGSGALFYEAETRSPLNSAATVVGPTGASGAGSNVVRHSSLTTTYRAILSTQASGGGAHLSHVGALRVFARFQVPTTNTGTVSVALEWGVGDLRRSAQNAAQAIDASWEGTWRLVDLGVVTVPRLTGTQQWEGRVIAKSTTVADSIDVDWLLLVPVSVGSGEAAGVLRMTSPSVYSGRDEFAQTAGALTGKTAPVGGTWGGAGDADDFNVSGSGLLQRTATGDTSGFQNGRLVTLSTPSLTNVVVQVDSRTSSEPPTHGVLARYTDANNLFAATYAIAGGAAVVTIVKRVASVQTTLALVTLLAHPVNTWYTIRAAILESGRWYVWFDPPDYSLSTVIASGLDTVFVTGGTLATGKVGIIDHQPGGGAPTRDYDNFAAWGLTDAAMFASRSLQIRHDGAWRQDSAGAIWQPVTDYEGDNLRVPPTGRAQRSVRFVVKASRGRLTEGADAGIDDINATLAVTPRYLSVPAPT